MTIDAFLDGNSRHRLARVSIHYSVAAKRPRTAREHGDPGGEQLYMVQQPVDAAPPPWLTISEKSAVTIESTNLWMSGSRDGMEQSACHYDLSDNLHVVVAGAKTFTLVAPSDTFQLYPVQVCRRPLPTQPFAEPICSLVTCLLHFVYLINMLGCRRARRLRVGIFSHPRHPQPANRRDVPTGAKAAQADA